MHQLFNPDTESGIIKQEFAERHPIQPSVAAANLTSMLSRFSNEALGKLPLLVNLTHYLVAIDPGSRPDLRQLEKSAREVGLSASNPTSDGDNTHRASTKKNAAQRTAFPNSHDLHGRVG